MMARQTVLDRRDSLIDSRTALAKLNAEIDVYVSFHKIYTPADFLAKVNALMNERGWDRGKFILNTQLNYQIYYDLINHVERQWEKITVLSIAVGLGLDADGIHELLSLAGIQLSMYSQDDIVYKALIQRLHGKKISVWDYVLESRNMPILGSNDR